MIEQRLLENYRLMSPENKEHFFSLVWAAASGDRKALQKHLEECRALLGACHGNFEAVGPHLLEDSRKKSQGL